MNKLVTREEILAAIAWRLGETLEQDRKKGRASGGSNKRWTRKCAIQAFDANRSGDHDTFWAAGVAVVQAHRAHRVSSSKRDGDSLSVVLRDYFRTRPNATWDDAWFNCITHASEECQPFSDFDRDYSLWIEYDAYYVDGRPIEDADGEEIRYPQNFKVIKRDPFRKRAERVKARLADG